MGLSEARGRLVAVGGAEDREGDCVILKEFVRLAKGAKARVVGMDICGVALVLRDISQPASKQGGGVIELNAAPGLRMHLFPSEGRPRDVGAAIIGMLYPHGADGRIPVISVTGTNGKTTVTRMIGHVFGESGRTVGMTTTDGIYVGGRCIAEGDTTGPHSARAVLSDPSVEAAVLETARGGITRRGLGYDWSDVAVLTNIRPDHIGQDGIETLDDLVYIKSLVAERVRDGGTLILNTDDEEVSRLLEIPRVAEGEKRVVYFSVHENHLLIKRHLDEGGTAYFVRDGWVVEAEGQVERRILKVSSVPATIGGRPSIRCRTCWRRSRPAARKASPSNSSRRRSRRSAAPSTTPVAAISSASLRAAT